VKGGGRENKRTKRDEEGVSKPMENSKGKEEEEEEKDKDKEKERHQHLSTHLEVALPLLLQLVLQHLAPLSVRNLKLLRNPHLDLLQFPRGNHLLQGG
jgi:hypothetical protein